MARVSTIEELHSAYLEQWRARVRRGRWGYIIKGKAPKRVFEMIIRDNAFKLKRKPISS